MKMSSIRRFIHAAVIVTAMIAGAISQTSCDSAIYDGQGDCSVHYRVSFRYTKNILNSDAFGAQVSDVSLYIFDKQGKLVLKKTEQRELTTDNMFYMDVDVEPGKYDLLAWCEGKSLNPDAISFTIANSDAPASINALSASLPLFGTAPNLYSDSYIRPFYHGIAYDVEFPDTYGTVDIAPVMLTKNTNRLSVFLQNVDGNPIDPAMFNVRLSGANSEITYRNDIAGNSPEFTYKPWSIESTEADFDEDATTSKAGKGMPSGLIAELSTGRLMANMPQRLTVSIESRQEPIIDIPLIDYLLIVRGKYDVATSNQDYLDRYDDYSLVFFIGEGMEWVKSKIYINGWRVVPPQYGDL